MVGSIDSARSRWPFMPLHTVKCKAILWYRSIKRYIGLEWLVNENDQRLSPLDLECNSIHLFYAPLSAANKTVFWNSNFELTPK